MIPLSSLSKLYHETDYHRFDVYKQKKAIMESLTERNQTQGTSKNIPWVFFQEHTHPLIEMSRSGSYNSQKCDLDNLFYF